ncbi:hypothetical protein ACM26W_07225 [Halomonas sp. HK25]|uniref:hypothetical protein n=1 Tax=Halomonas sp. HK25 TaxID=3394321 RepID=UPI0039FC3560
MTAAGFRVVPHLAARLVRDRPHLIGLLERLAALGVEDAFVVGGDPRGYPHPVARWRQRVR